jgi:hypothetical protein
MFSSSTAWEGYRLLSPFPPNRVHWVVVVGNVNIQVMIGGEIPVALDAPIDMILRVVDVVVFIGGEAKGSVRGEMAFHYWYCCLC